MDRFAQNIRIILFLAYLLQKICIKLDSDLFMYHMRSLVEWKNWLKLGDVYPVFQPVVSTETGEIYGYEVLGRYLPEYDDNREPESMGPFFLASIKNRTDSQEFIQLKKDIDQKIREKALIEFARNQEKSSSLFLNISPMSMKEYLNSKTMELPFTVQVVRKLGIRPDRIIIEITEERLDENLEQIRPIIDIYRREGFRIAVDDVGSESSNLDRIGLFHPDIIKVDLQMLRRSVFSRNFKEILFTLSRLGESLGSSLLFEGIENEEELNNALNYGSRYLQGFYFAKPIKNFLEPKYFSEQLRLALDNFHEKKTREVFETLSWEDKIQNQLSDVLKYFANYNNSDRIDSSVMNSIESCVFRLYITDEKGFQISPNYYRSVEGRIEEDHSYIGRNWSWRPFFYEHSYKSVVSKKSWMVSSLYHDISENVMLKTFSKNLNNNFILFVDVVFEM
ncbi:EAL domain-containing protein [Leptospira sp. GIMC2001]|uniref:EAL domain-containing protein n=1 Tax=Leptospira sp. GIMC2001 TaxID=1513297 RepID=UPI00234B2C85|nr:EAL domain-containing protein [Leptospira sp. GIMC2001]WCL48343.1 EAL domain-containing protein [Leptospira sp. GIMC2001]